MIPEKLAVGDRVLVYLESTYWESEGWFGGVIVRIDAYSKSNFYWVQLDSLIEAKHGGSTGLVSVLNPRNIKKE